LRPGKSIVNNFNFSESFFDTSLDLSHSLHENSKVDEDIFDELRQLKRKHPKKFICVYLNINSLRYKFCHICELLTSNTIDMLFLAETKIDDQFPDAQFQVNNYHFWRADRTAYGGGIAAYVRSDLPCDRKKILEFKNIESICIEILVGNKKWLISGVYRPQTINDFSNFIQIRFH
jgi:exonuclease III